MRSKDEQRDKNGRQGRCHVKCAMCCVWLWPRLNLVSPQRSRGERSGYNPQDPPTGAQTSIRPAARPKGNQQLFSADLLSLLLLPPLPSSTSCPALPHPLKLGPSSSTTSSPPPPPSCPRPRQ
eukprot:758037-Hanusia_phi.AAC.1